MFPLEMAVPVHSPVFVALRSRGSAEPNPEYSKIAIEGVPPAVQVTVKELPPVTL